MVTSVVIMVCISPSYHGQKSAYRMKLKLICSVLLAVCLFIAISPANANAGGIVISGAVPLIIYNVSSSPVNSSGASQQLPWTTNGSASSQVFYDTNRIRISRITLFKPPSTTRLS